MNFDKLVSKLEGLRKQTDSLENCITKTLHHQQDGVLFQTYEELSNSLEELSVAEEELCQQNEQLSIYHQELEKERKRYQELFDFAPDGYLVTDTHGKILEANQAASQLLLIEKTKITGKLIISFVPQEVRKEFRNKLDYLWKETQLRDWEIDLYNSQKNLFSCEISVSIISDDDGNCIGIRWLLRDISARKLAEQELARQKMLFVEQQNIQLQESSQLKSKIVAVLSHELRTPLNAVIGFSDLLLRLNRTQFSPQSLKIAETITRNGKQLLTLINNMLDFAKLEEGKLTIKQQQFNIKELVQTLTDDLRLIANQKGISLDVHINIKDVKVINDSIRVQQILTNLICNAIKFTEHGSVLVELKELGKNKISVTVQDTGIGISESDLKHIFEAFSQLNNTKSYTHHGTGIGLAIVKDILNLMGGTITVESLLGEGSIFRIELPRVVNSEQLSTNNYQVRSKCFSTPSSDKSPTTN